MDDLAVDLQRVSKRFTSTVALEDLTLSIARGSVFGVLGANGAGKTTMIRILLGLISADAGRARVLGLDPASAAQAVRRRVGVLLEHDGLYERMSALRNLELFAAIHHLGRAERQARIESLLRTFGLWERRTERPAMWSTGMRKKLAIARSLLHRPALLLLDEPFAGLDPAAAVDLRELISSYAKEQGLTVIMTTHDLAHAERGCDRVVVIEAGRVLAEGTPDMLGTTSGLTEAEIVGDGLTLALLAAMQGEQLLSTYRLEGRTATVSCSAANFPRLGTELVRRGVQLEQLRKTGRSLEDAVLALMRREPGAESK